MTNKPAHKPAGTSDGGQFAKTSHGEPSLTLTPEQKRETERARPLTITDLEWLQKAHGTYDPGEHYYTHMPKVFEAALEKAAVTPEGRRELALRAKAEELSAITGVSAKDIRGFHDEISKVETDSEAWESLLQTYCEHYFRSPRGTGVFIESQMREAGRPVTERAALAGQRRELDARIGAIDVAGAADAIRSRFPKAAAVTSWRSSEQVFSPDELTVRVTSAEGKRLWEGPREEIPELGTLSLVPDQYQRQDSPLRTSSVPHYNHSWHSYSLDKMAAVTAEQLMEDA